MGGDARRAGKGGLRMSTQPLTNLPKPIDFQSRSMRLNSKRRSAMNYLIGTACRASDSYRAVLPRRDSFLSDIQGCKLTQYGLFYSCASSGRRRGRRHGERDSRLWHHSSACQLDGNSDWHRCRSVSRRVRPGEVACQRDPIYRRCAEWRAVHRDGYLRLLAACTGAVTSPRLRVEWHLQS